MLAVQHTDAWDTASAVLSDIRDGKIQNVTDEQIAAIRQVYDDMKTAIESGMVSPELTTRAINAHDHLNSLINKLTTQ